jgi:hypothetical protein
LLDEYKIDNEDIVLQYAKETNAIKIDEEIIIIGQVNFNVKIYYIDYEINR